MTVTQLVALYHRAPLPAGRVEESFSPEQAAGAMVEEHGLRVALMMARSHAEYLPASTAFEMQVWQVLQAASED